MTLAEHLQSAKSWSKATLHCPVWQPLATAAEELVMCGFQPKIPRKENSRTRDNVLNVLWSYMAFMFTLP